MLAQKQLAVYTNQRTKRRPRYVHIIARSLVKEYPGSLHRQVCCNEVKFQECIDDYWIPSVRSMGQFLRCQRDYSEVETQITYTGQFASRPNPRTI